MNKTIENYILQQKIGSGQYGNVYRAEHKQTKQLYAVKVMNSDKFKQTPKLTQFTNNQINILSKMSHPNIIRFVQMLRTTNNYYLVYEYCNGGTLADHIKKKGRLTQQEALKILQQLRLAYEALYQAHILHRDIKPTNILFNNGLIKLADFGFCKELLKENDMAQTMVGSPIYMAPQILKGLTYDSRADLWSIGVILYEMLYGHCPFEESSIPKLITLIDNNYLKIPSEPLISQNVKVLMMRLLTLKYKQRLTPLQFIKYDLGKIHIEAEGQQNGYFSFREVGKYVRRALIYLTQTLDLITNQINNVLFLRITFMLCKIINSILNDTLIGGAYWQNLSIRNIEGNWEGVIQEEKKLCEPYLQLIRQALTREDTSLKTKVELETFYIDSRYFLQNIRKVQEENTKFRLLNCFLFNKHFAMVIEKRPPEWNDFVEDGMPIKEKQEVCLKFARYY